MLNKCNLMFLSLIIAICFYSCCCDDFFDDDNKNLTHINVTEEPQKRITVEVEVYNKDKNQYNIKIINDIFSGKAYIREIKSDNIDVKSVCIKKNEGNEISLKDDGKHLLAIVGIIKDLKNINEKPNRYLVYIPECEIDKKYYSPFCYNQNIIHVKILSICEEIESLESLFWGCYNLKTVDLSKLDTSKVKNMSSMFSGCTGLTEIKFPADFGSACEDMSWMFAGCISLENIDLFKFNTSSVKNMSCMFKGCGGLEEIILPKKFGSACENMSYMFYFYSNLKKIEFPEGFGSACENMSYMFGGCANLKDINVPNLDTTKVKNMIGMFSKCSSLKDINLLNFSTSEVTNMSYMFYGCEGLTDIIFPENLDISKVQYNDKMFSGCDKLSNDTKGKINELGLPLLV